MFTLSLTAIAVCIGIQNKGVKREFCLLWAAVLAGWAVITKALASLDTAAMTDTEYSVAVFACYLSCAMLNFILLNYLYRNQDSGYTLIAIPIAFYAFLSLLVPIEHILFNTEAAYRLFQSSSLPANTIEIILLAGADHGLRNSRRLASVGHAIIRPLSALRFYTKVHH